MFQNSTKIRKMESFTVIIQRMYRHCISHLGTGPMNRITVHAWDGANQ